MPPASPLTYVKDRVRSRPRLRQLALRVLYALPSGLRKRLLRAAERPAGGGRAASRAYSDAELLARAEEFNRAAEVYWKEVAEEPAGRSHALSKPLTTVQDASGILYRLGLILHELRLGVGHTVLDLGAGSCWLSSYINRLRCRTIAMDVSPSALELGREVFRLDPRQRWDLDPEFLAYDGHRIPLPDESVDRVVCFDSFHHVPNQEEILAEVHRVLKPGGRAVFAEPGEGHSHADQSVFETERCGVLENDLELPDIAGKARRAGFTEMLVKPYPDQGALSFHVSDYLRFMDGEDRLFPMAALKESLRHFYVFVLAKGDEVFDSRNPKTLRAEISLPDGLAAVTGVSGAEVELRVRVRNAGDTLWLHEETSWGGYVMLGGHLHRKNERRDLVARGFLRTALPGPVAPGEAVDLRARFHLPREQGRYLLRLDMVDEWIAWFEQTGSPAVELDLAVEGWPDSRKPDRLEAEIAVRGETRWRTRPGAGLAVSVAARNTGNTVWLRETPDGAGAVGLGGHLYEGDRVVHWDFFRAALPKDVAPGEVAALEARFRAPALPGRYRLRLDLVAQGVYWFEHLGGAVPEIALEVADEPTDSASPGLLRARIEASPSALSGAAGSSLRLDVRVANEGNTLWLHEEPPGEGAGQVRLGGHLLSEAGETLDVDFFRAALPRPVAPGNSVEVTCEVAAPARPGRYVLELDMVDEGITWFGPTGSPTLRVPLDCA